MNRVKYKARFYGYYNFLKSMIELTGDYINYKQNVFSSALLFFSYYIITFIIPCTCSILKV